MEYVSELVNYGALGVLTILLVIGIRVLYRRNCANSDTVVELSKKSTEVIAKNTEVLGQHTDAIRELKNVLAQKL